MHTTKAITFVCALLLALEICSAQPTPGVYFTKLGGAGSYNEITNMQPGTWPPPCNVQNPCSTQTKTISASPLAPFNEEVALHLRGPQNLNKIYVYQKVGTSFSLTSQWSAGGSSANISFLSLSGDWTVCAGNALGYTNSYGNASSSTPQVLNGFLAEALEIVVTSAVPCSGTADCGYYRGVGLHSWAGDKIFVVETMMPFGTAGDVPAVWSLNAKISRTAQYGCNCGRDGCGEFDIAEIITKGDTRAWMTLYSYNGNVGTPAYFPRPVSQSTIYYVHYSVADNRIYALNIPQGKFSYATTLAQSYVSCLESVAVDVSAFTNNPNTGATFNCPISGTSAPSTSAPTPTTTTTTAPAPTTTTTTTKAAATTTTPTTTTTKAAATTTAAPTITTTKAATTTPPTTTTNSAGTTTTTTTKSASTGLINPLVLYSKSANAYVVADNYNNLYATASAAAYASVLNVTAAAGGLNVKNVATGLFASADQSGTATVIANRAAPSGWELFIFTAVGQYYTIQAASNSKYVGVDASSRALINSISAASASAVPDQGLFQLVSPPATALKIQTTFLSKSANLYLAIDASTKKVYANAANAAGATLFALATVAQNTATIRSVSTSNYASADQTGTSVVTVDRGAASGWESFTFTQVGQYWAILAQSNGKYLSVQSGTQAIVNSVSATSASAVPDTALFALV